MAPVSPSLTVNRMHEPLGRLYRFFSTRSLLSRSSRLRSFKQDDFSWLQKDKMGHICMFIEQNEQDEAHHIHNKQPSYFELCMQPRRPLCDFMAFVKLALTLTATIISNGPLHFYFVLLEEAMLRKFPLIGRGISQEFN